MSQDRNPITMKKVLYDMPGTDAVTVQRDVEFPGAEGGALAMDVYVPPGSASGGRTPAVVIVEGYPDLGFKAKLGCSFKDMGLVGLMGATRRRLGDGGDRIHEPGTGS